MENLSPTKISYKISASKTELLNKNAENSSIFWCLIWSDLFRIVYEKESSFQLFQPLWFFSSELLRGLEERGSVLCIFLIGWHNSWLTLLLFPGFPKLILKQLNIIIILIFLQFVNFLHQNGRKFTKQCFFLSLSLITVFLDRIQFLVW